MTKIARSSGPFLEWLDRWLAGLPDETMSGLVKQTGGASRVAVFCVDLTVGFCSEGALSSPRVEGIVEPIARLFRLAHSSGVRQFILPQDSHPADSPEFGAFPPHCVAGSAEADTVPQLEALPFASTFVRIPKQSVSPAAGTDLEETLDSLLVDTAICVGDCTDICLYQMAMFLKTRATAEGRPVRVVVPADCAQTYDMGVDDAAKVGALPHPGDLMHGVFLYHMALNGISVVRTIDA